MFKKDKIMCLIFAMVMLLMIVLPVSAQFKIGVNTFSQANYSCILIRETMIDEVEKLGGIAIDSVTDTVPERMNAIENFIAMGVDAIILASGDGALVSTALEEAKKQGILIGTVEAGISDLFDIASDNNDWVNAAYAATELIDLIGGKGKIVEIINDVGAMIRARRKILHAVISEYPQVELVASPVYNWPDYYPDTLAKMESILQAHPDLVGVFGGFEGVAIAACEVIREAGLQDQVVVVTPGSSPEAFDEMIKPDSPLKIYTEQDFEGMARETVRGIMKLLNGEGVPKRNIALTGKVITMDNFTESGFYN